MITLVVNTYRHANFKRTAEIKQALANNKANPYLRIVTVGEHKDSSDHWLTSQQPTYKNLIDIANNYNGVKIIANADIYFDLTIRLAATIKEKEVYCLARYEDGVLKDRPDSQDAWIWRGTMRLNGGNYHLGRAGSDNRLAYELRQSGYRVLNPAKTIKAHHLHASQQRDPKKRVTVPPPYLTISPHELTTHSDCKTPAVT